MPQGGRQPPRKKAASDGEAPSGSTTTWKRHGGGFSGAAKKEYLKWKRQQAAARTDESSSDVEAADPQLVQHAGKEAQHQRRRPHSNASAEATAPLCYRPLVAVPAARFSMQHDAACTAGAASADTSITSSNGGSSSSRHHGGAEHAPAQMTYMPQLDPAEVGFTPEGCSLGMPTRPAWQGVVNTAKELHALEEQTFEAWQAELTSKAQQVAPAGSTDSTAAAAATSAAAGAAGGSNQTQQETQEQQQQQQQQRQLTQGLAAGPGPISAYEGRLEFWRQLWRTLEMSDVICMIVDARNPLLHFSPALYRHITQDHQLPVVLLLNKCDLVSAAAAAAWQQWLQQQFPGVAVIPVSAAKEQADATARQVLQAVLQQQVLREGVRVPVQELVGLTLDELLQESIQRNTHAKRHLQAVVQQQQQDERQEQQQQRGMQGRRAAEDAAGAATASAASSEGEEEDWSTGVNRGARKAGRKGRRRKQREQQQQQQQAAGPSGASASDAEGPGRWGNECDEIESDQQEQQQQQHKQDDDDDEAYEVDEMLASLTLERRLSSTTSSCGPGMGLASGSADTAVAGTAAAAGGACGTVGNSSSAGQGGGSSSTGSKRPVVVGMLGEPNVGKSSTLNALLGAHRVAVSSHPGRTKHYQTHYMCDTLVLVDCPGIVFPRLSVSPAMQVLFGSSPIASCRQPYAVVRYLAEASWPRVQDTLHLQLQPDAPTLQTAAQQDVQQQQQAQNPGCSADNCGGGNGSGGPQITAAAAAVLAGGPDSSGWSPWSLCEALATKRHWVLPRSGRLDTYRAANWLLRAALAGQQGVGLAFLPPAAGPAGPGGGGGAAAGCV